MQKIYISPNDYMHDIWRLGAQIRASAWCPDILIALWRGGAPVGVAVHEYLKAFGWSLEHLPLKCFSYTAIGQNEGDVTFVGAEAILSTLKPNQRVLVVDDVFDTGKTIAAMRDLLSPYGVDARYACVYWKPSHNLTTLKPDYFAADKDHKWIVFPHELSGLTQSELQEKDPFLSTLKM